MHFPPQMQLFGKASDMTVFKNWKCSRRWRRGLTGKWHHLNNVAFRRPQLCPVPWPNCSCGLAISHWLFFQGKSQTSGLLFLISGCDFLLTSQKPCNKAISGYFSNPPLRTSKEKNRSQYGADLSWAGQLYLCSLTWSPIWGVLFPLTRHLEDVKDSAPLHFLGPGLLFSASGFVIATLKLWTWP